MHGDRDEQRRARRSVGSVECVRAGDCARSADGLGRDRCERVGSVVFVATANDGGATITGYTVACSSPDGGAAGSGSGIASPVVVGGLTNGKTYVSAATATNSVGTSVPSASSNTFVPVTCASRCVSIGDGSMLETDSGTHALSLAVTLSQPSTVSVSVQYAVTGTTA